MRSINGKKYPFDNFGVILIITGCVLMGHGVGSVDLAAYICGSIAVLAGIMACNLEERL